MRPVKTLVMQDFSTVSYYTWEDYAKSELLHGKCWAVDYTVPQGATADFYPVVGLEHVRYASYKQFSGIYFAGTFDDLAEHIRNFGPVTEFRILSDGYSICSRLIPSTDDRFVWRTGHLSLRTAKSYNNALKKELKEVKSDITRLERRLVEDLDVLSETLHLLGLDTYKCNSYWLRWLYRSETRAKGVEASFTKKGALAWLKANKPNATRMLQLVKRTQFTDLQRFSSRKSALLQLDHLKEKRQVIEARLVSLGRAV